MLAQSIDLCTQFVEACLISWILGGLILLRIRVPVFFENLRYTLVLPPYPLPHESATSCIEVGISFLVDFVRQFGLILDDLVEQFSLILNDLLLRIRILVCQPGLRFASLLPHPKS